MTSLFCVDSLDEPSLTVTFVVVMPTSTIVVVISDAPEIVVKISAFPVELSGAFVSRDDDCSVGVTVVVVVSAAVVVVSCAPVVVVVSCAPVVVVVSDLVVVVELPVGRVVTGAVVVVTLVVVVVVDEMSS